MIYTIRNQCIELPEMDSDDDAATIFLNVKGAKGDPPEDLKVLLRYLSDIRAENACNPKLAQIPNCIEKFKQDPKVWRQYMNWQEYIELERKEAVEKQKKENDVLKKRADEAEAEVLRLKALLKSNGINVENECL